MVSFLKIISLGSGSNGNAFLADAGEGLVLFDVGIPIRTLQRSLGDAGYSFDDIAAAFISHEHSDHVRALGPLCRRFDFRCLVSQGTRDAILDRSNLPRIPQFEEIAAGNGVQIAGLNVTPVPVAHDAAEPIGFLIEQDSSRVGLFTDLGHASSDVVDAIQDLDLLIIESNYDEDLLANGPYPRRTKQRIRSKLGHLGNVDCARLLETSLPSSIQEIWLAHLSANNNQPKRALATIKHHLSLNDDSITFIPLPRYGSEAIQWRSDLRRPARFVQAPLPIG